MKELSEYRAEFEIARKYAFLNNAAISSPPSRVLKAVNDLFLEFGNQGLTLYPQWMKRIETARALFAELINAEPHEISFTGNTSEGLNTVANGISWKSGDSILVPVPDFPSNVYPWVNLVRMGAEVYFLQKKEGRFGLRDITSVLRPRTRLIAVSSTDFTTGFRCGLEEIGDFCHRQGILLCVDAIQSVGAIPLDVKKCGVHFLACGGHKWLLSTMGIGALYIAEEVNDQLHPARVGWRSVEHEEDFYNLELNLKTDARRFETGTMNLAGITALSAAVEMLLEIGMERVFSRILHLNGIIASELGKRGLKILSAMEPEHRSGILSFLPEDAGGMFRHLYEGKVIAAQRGEALRLSPHFYNDESDIEKFLAVLDSYPGGK
ncbi:MAG: aminotransferase class V-fold PLP-dependent enzyme [Syntrophobacteraceae bacterium]